MDFLTPIEIEAIILSTRVAVWAMVWSLPLAIATAWVLARCDFPGKSLLDGLVHLPLVLPPVVVGYVLLIALGRKGFLGAWIYDWFGISFAFSWRGAAIASGLIAFPLVVRAIRLSLEAVDRRLEDAARTLGAGPIGIFFTITLPLIAPGILAGAILGFARSLSEFGATITFVSNIPGETRTLPIALYGFTQVPDGEQAAIRLVIIAIVIAFAALAASEILARRLQRRMDSAR
jgi:molybdate transport system permease protein